MRNWLIIVGVLSAFGAGCGNEYHPEYHPQTSLRYSVSTSNPVHVQGVQGQPVYVAPLPAQQQSGQAQAPSGQIVLPAPPTPPTPPEGFGW